MDGLVASTVGHEIHREVAVRHQLREPLIDCPHVAVELFVGGGGVAVGEEDDEVVLRAGADQLYAVFDLH